MRSKVARRIIDETPEDVKIFVRLYSDITVRINQILKEKGISQKQLAEAMGKKQSEISKWLNGEHNFTLRSLAKLQAELGEDLISVPAHRQESPSISGSVKTIVCNNTHYPIKSNRFERYTLNNKTINQTNRRVS